MMSKEKVIEDALATKFIDELGLQTKEDYQDEKTFDWLLVIDIVARRVVIVEDEHARTLYEEGGDGVLIALSGDDYYECKLPEITPIKPDTNLSTYYQRADEQFLSF